MIIGLTCAKKTGSGALSVIEEIAAVDPVVVGAEIGLLDSFSGTTKRFPAICGPGSEAIRVAVTR